ncbi:EAL domain-containing response regulator [Motiliproteus coralliicola]|uniref:EAL domain-containing response regulator n=1 Tax=Motiliproteus coralliicola TaxID=2283196 RepID=UPI0010587959|nr:EAL domain-containing protein [Motiliproteus coralliicola]
MDDEVNIIQSFQRLFRKAPFRILTANGGQQALEVLAHEQVDVVVSDQRMPGMTGAELFAVVQQKYPNTTRLLLSGYTDFDALTYAINNGSISKFISKPWNRDELRQSLDEAFAHTEELNVQSDYDSVFQHSSQGMALLDPQYRVLAVNQAQLALTGHREEEVVGKLLFDLIPELNRAQIEQEVAAHQHWRSELWLLRRDKSIGLFSLTIQLNPANQRLSVTCADITEMRRNELSSRHDLLTGLLNRQSFEREVAEFLTQKSQDQMLAVLSLDLINFRQVNESYGHDYGDELLCQVASSLRAMLGSDLSIQRIARIGGDEFALLCQADYSAAFLQLCESILSWFQAPIQVHDNELFMHFKLGVAIAYGEVKAADLIKQAATAGARSDRAHRYRVYDDEMLEGVKERMDLHNDLHRVIKNNELALLYQPKIEISTGRIVSAEALVRWNHPTKGLISPDRFVFLAEETGLILDIGDWCISEACRQLADWQQQDVGPVRIAVNLSPRQFTDRSLPHRLQALINHHQLQGSVLELEVTESTLLDDTDRAIKMMQQICSMDVHFAMDDFGTGYASFDYLKRYPFSTLKIDRSFIMHMCSSEREGSIVQSMIEMGHQLGLVVVAEGVEEQEQADSLKAMGCDFIQGFLYSRPVSAQELQKLLVEQPFSIER